MLKKKIVMLVAAAMMTLTASSAFAAFADLRLIRVYYDRAGAEYATDLGDIKTLLATPSTTIDGSFTGALGGTKHAVYFALDRDTSKSDLWASNSTTVVPSVIGGSTGMTSLISGVTSTFALYNLQGGTNYAGQASNTSSYKNKLSPTQGWLGNTITGTASRAATELSLATLATKNVQTLYFWDNARATTTIDKKGVAVATITTNANGSTTITTTPIPAAFYLMGSGLMGLVGLRRRKNA